MEHWEIAKKEAEEKKALLEKFPDLGKKVRRRGRKKMEYGIVVLDRFDDEPEPYEFIQYDDGTKEQLMCLPYEVFDEATQTWVDGNGLKL